MLQKLFASLAVLLSWSIATANAEIVSFVELSNQSTVPTLNNAFGALDMAVNFTNTGGTTLSQGILFTNAPIGSGSFGTWNGISVDGGAGTSWGTFNADSDPWLSFAYITPSSNATVTVAGLSAAKEYQIEYLFGDSRHEYSPFAYTTVVTDSLGHTANGAIEWNVAAEDAPPSYALSTITVKDTTSVSYAFTQTSAGGFGISGIVIRQVPEPSSLVLVLLGSIGLLTYASLRRK